MVNQQLFTGFAKHILLELLSHIAKDTYVYKHFLQNAPLFKFVPVKNIEIFEKYACYCCLVQY